MRRIRGGHLVDGFELIRTRPGLAARFWQKVNRSGPIPAHRQEIGSCWIWCGAKTRLGYGEVKILNASFFAHRVAYELTVGRIPDGLYACHHCDNPGCVRPEHLFLGTQLENMRDCFAKKRNGQAVRPESYAASNQPCRICGRYRSPLRHGRCDTCRSYFRRCGSERPFRAADAATGEDARP
jgi:ribosomal protein S14